MIYDVLEFLKDDLNEHLLEVSEVDPDAATVDKVVFPTNQASGDAISFVQDKVTALLINVEQEHVLRSAEPYIRRTADGGQFGVMPDLQLNLYVLFVANYTDYPVALKQLSRIIQHFQKCRVFRQQNAPKLSDQIDQLVLELVTLPLREQNDLWSALRTAYRPSAFYKVRMIVYRDEDGTELPVIQEQERRLLSL